MGLRDIIVVLDDTKRNEVCRSVAVKLALAHDAHLTGVCPLDLLYPANMGLLLGGYPDMLSIQYATDQMTEQAMARAKPIEGAFREDLRRQGLRGDWELLSGIAGAAVASRARTADLSVIAQPNPDEPLSASARLLLEDVLMTSGRPVLAIPFAGNFETIGKNVLVAWSDSREAARGLNDAIPLMDTAATVTVLSVQRAAVSEDEPLPTADAADHLARHGFKAVAARTVNDGSISDADALLSYAADIGADLIVSGCYGHSRTRELVLGGVTRGLLQSMTVPTLMSH